MTAAIRGAGSSARAAVVRVTTARPTQNRVSASSCPRQSPRGLHAKKYIQRQDIMTYRLHPDTADRHLAHPADALLPRARAHHAPAFAHSTQKPTSITIHAPYAQFFSSCPVSPINTEYSGGDLRETASSAQQARRREPRAASEIAGNAKQPIRAKRRRRVQKNRPIVSMQPTKSGCAIAQSAALVLDVRASPKVGPMSEFVASTIAPGGNEGERG